MGGMIFAALEDEKIVLRNVFKLLSLLIYLEDIFNPKLFA